MSNKKQAVALFSIYKIIKNKNRKRRINRKRVHKCWVNPYSAKRSIKGRFVKDFNDMKANPNVFMDNFHMNEITFNELYKLVEPYLLLKRYTRPDILGPMHKLAVVLEYLASGTLPRHLASVYRIIKSRLGVVINVICEAICKVLKPYMSKMDKVDLLNVANGFMNRWNLPNCLGAMDGKHVGLRAPRKSGSMFFNYKGFYSIVLFAVADSQYKFTFLDIGAYGSEGYANVFSNSEFGKAVFAETINFPEHANLLDKKVPFFFIGDDAFSLTRRILKPFGGKNLSEEENIFNYRLSRARRCVENAFGILCSKWLCLKRTIFSKPDRAQKIVAACCLLHNFLLTKSNNYCLRDYGDQLSSDGKLIEGEWRQKIRDVQASTLFSSNLDSFRGRQNEFGKRVRDVVKNYVNSPEGSVPWQRQAVVLL